MLVGRLAFSERRACRLAGQHRSTQRHEPSQPTAQDSDLREQLRQIAERTPRWGYRRARGHLRENGCSVNRKRLWRLWREEGLRVPQKTRKRRRTGGPNAQHLRAERPRSAVGAGRPVRRSTGGCSGLLNIVNEFTREALALRGDRSITAEQTVRVLEALVAARGCPQNIRCDNGPPELTAKALRDWCTSTHVTTSYIEPGAPWQNPFAESFNARVRDELLNLEECSCLAEARVLTEDWRQDFNAEHPHCALGYRSPAAFAAAWTTARAA